MARLIDEILENDFLGNASDMARSFGVSRSTIDYWKRLGFIPSKYAEVGQVATGNRVPMKKFFSEARKVAAEQEEKQ